MSNLGVCELCPHSTMVAEGQLGGGAESREEVELEWWLEVGCPSHLILSDTIGRCRDQTCCSMQARA